MVEKYFAASNSGSGFCNYFGEIFSSDRLDKVYIIKGGPGTGKSYFMKSVARAAEEGGKSVIYYYCSSDQASLDGIIINERIGIFDGTAPHSAEADIPGAVHEIIDLGRFWDARALLERKEEITRLSAEKKKHYFRAYRYLAAYKSICEAEEKLCFGLVQREKLKKAVNSVLSGIKIGAGFEMKLALTDSIGMRGRVRFDTLEKKAKKIYKITNNLDTAHFFLSHLLERAAEMSLTVTVSYDPILPERIDAVFLDNEDILFTIGCAAEDERVKGVAMARFFAPEKLSEVRGALKRSRKLRDLLLSDALGIFGEIEKVHFALEEIYKSAMDFIGKEVFTDNFIKELLT